VSNENGVLVPVNGAKSNGGNVLTKQEMGAVTTIKQAETAAMAIAAQAEAAIKARYSLALLRPRDWDVVRQKVLKECQRPSLAEVAVYSKPQGRKFNDKTGEWEDNFVEGLSIRFAEVAMRCMGNLMPETTAIYDDEKIRIVRVALTDLEANNYFVKDVVIEKTVERSKLPKGAVPLRSRTNTGGKPVYILQATDDEVNTKENALASKALRNHVLRVFPGDLQDESRRILDETYRNKDAKDPDAGRKEIADAFAALNIMPDQIKMWLGHDLATADTAERAQLRKIYSTIKAGELSWSELMEQREEQRAQSEQVKKDAAPANGEQKPGAPADAAPSRNLADVKARAKQKAPEQTKPAGTRIKVEGHEVNVDDTGPCSFSDTTTGEVCDKEGYKFPHVGYRCGDHVPSPPLSDEAPIK
jgi:hypothetical protein